jgi:hypothetical protein
MNSSHSASFSLVYLNAQSLPASLMSAWQSLVTDPAHDPALPSTPLLYVLVESDHREPKPGVRGWSCFHQPGPVPPGKNGKGGGGISLLYHSDCAVKPLHAHSIRIDPPIPPSTSASSAVICAIIRPRHRAPFLLAAVYLPPQCATTPAHLDRLTAAIDAAAQAHPTLPLLVVGDFNCHHPDWSCPLHPGLTSLPSPSSCANRLADWITDTPLYICNPPGVPTRHCIVSNQQQTSIIDLVLTDRPGLATSVTQLHSSFFRTDHTPFTIELALHSSLPAARPVDSRPRVTWDQHRCAEAWQTQLPLALSTSLSPLQPSLLSLTQPLSSDVSAQALLDDVYSRFESILLATCKEVVGTKVVRPYSSPWISYPGVQAARQTLISALRAVQLSPSDIPARHQLRIARRAWAKISTQAKLESSSDLCEQIMQPDCKLRWSMFKRASPTPFTSLSSIAHPSAQPGDDLPVSHAASLDNLCTSFVANGTPPPPLDPTTQSDLEQQVAAWSLPSSPSIPPHPSNSWTFTAADVEQQCTTQHTNTAPGPDALLPVFFKYVGKDAWTALSLLYSFSWTHSVTPQAWREANVMALYKGAGDKSVASSYRPISMTSIIIRIFEHLIHRRLVAELEGAGYFALTQSGFRKGRSTTDAINFLLTAIQRFLSKGGGKEHDNPQCPVLFLDIQKAFDRVDHSILLHRVQAAGITGKAWLWIHSFLSSRRMRCVDASEHSQWQPTHYGVPQGCVLSPLLFLIFINDLQNTISSDPACSNLSPYFFADDGAIGPNPFRKHLPTATRETTYLNQLKAAIAHLDRWCLESRMQFGAAKTQIVVFTTRMHPNPTPYSSLRLCNFTISIASEYKYLGVILTSRLEWARHAQYALSRAKRASALVTRVALRARDVSFTAIRSLVLGYVIPSFSYGILFWGRHYDLPDSTCRQLQAQIATPLRAALSLPRTTHQLGVLELCHVPSVSALSLRAQLSYLHRVCDPTFLPSSHPTKRLHRSSLNDIHNARKNASPASLLQPACLLPTSVYLCSSVYPYVCHEPSLLPQLGVEAQNTLCSSSPQRWEKGAEYWRRSGSDRRTWAQAHYRLSHLTDALNWSAQSAPHLTPQLIRRLCKQLTHSEWRASHAPSIPPPIPPPAPSPHSTTAPLTECKPTPSLPPFLSSRSPDSHRQQVSRARLLMGRARTATVRLRFAKAADAPSTSPLCSLCSTPSSPVLDSISHMLLHCVRSTQERIQLQSDLSSLGLPSPSLSLSIILAASPPPPPFPSTRLPSLLRFTSTFLLAVAAARATANLVPLDTG